MHRSTAERRSHESAKTIYPGNVTDERSSHDTVFVGKEIMDRISQSDILEIKQPDSIEAVYQKIESAPLQADASADSSAEKPAGNITRIEQAPDAEDFQRVAMIDEGTSEKSRQTIKAEEIARIEEQRQAENAAHKLRQQVQLEQMAERKKLDEENKSKLDARESLSPKIYGEPVSEEDFDKVYWELERLFANDNSSENPLLKQDVFDKLAQIAEIKKRTDYRREIEAYVDEVVKETDFGVPSASESFAHFLAQKDEYKNKLLDLADFYRLDIKQIDDYEVSEADLDIITEQLKDLVKLPAGQFEEQKQMMVDDWPMLDDIFKLTEIDDPKEFEIAERHLAHDITEIIRHDPAVDAGNIYKLVGIAKTIMKNRPK